MKAWFIVIRQLSISMEESKSKITRLVILCALIYLLQESRVMRHATKTRRQSPLKWSNWLLAPFVCKHHSLHSLAPQRCTLPCSHCSLAPFTGSLSHFTQSPMGLLTFMNISLSYKIDLNERTWLLSWNAQRACFYSGIGAKTTKTEESFFVSR